MSNTVPNRVSVQTGSRLHFGMFSFGNSDVRQFGGVGAMVSQPGISILITPAQRLVVTGLLAARAQQIIERTLPMIQQELATRDESVSQYPSIHVLHAPRQHTGLGVGTQLSLALVAGLRQFYGLPTLSARQLAEYAGRAERSAIGTYGFLQGGLLVEAGKKEV
ncbi:MAG: hypothetical protein SGJ20_22810, partial [Planctomycetota bacterium]|nr:hypothetical protein [Planctomycetota bacterium]